ncbi:hypothetical protein C8R48DRAFT_674033 [Suillus tomentosus]|nr:hypothetical protein C8R48DRAFT_674033 [Suillus tomentosus]
MDEYVSIPRDHPESYHTFMFCEFFSHSPSSPVTLAEESYTNFINAVDIPLSQVNLLDGNTKYLVAECNTYKFCIKQGGGIELFLGGIGEDGHVAFNEPGSSLASQTHIKTLAFDTIGSNLLPSSSVPSHYLQHHPATSLTQGLVPNLMLLLAAILDPCP